MLAERSVVRTFPTMGTIASVHVRAAAPAVVDDAVARLHAELDRVEDVFSTFRPHSAVCRIDRGELHLLDAPAEVVDVLDACTWLEHASGGAFRARRPDGALDPAGFVKGWAADRASRHLDEAGLRHWYLSVGGDLVARGVAPDGAPWRIAVADPRAPGGVVAVVDLADQAMATSGPAERGDHVWDGRDGRPASAWASVTVVGPSLAWADAFATTVCALGAGGLAWLAALPGYDALAVTHDGRLLTSSGVRLS